MASGSCSIIMLLLSYLSSVWLFDRLIPPPNPTASPRLKINRRRLPAREVAINNHINEIDPGIRAIRLARCRSRGSRGARPRRRTISRRAGVILFEAAAVRADGLGNGIWVWKLGAAVVDAWRIFSSLVSLVWVCGLGIWLREISLFFPQ